MQKNPKIIDKRVISENKLMAFVEEDLLIENSDRPYTYYQLDAKLDAVLVIPVFENGEVLLEKIYRHPFRKWFYEFPAGGIEKDEPPIEAAKRELLEETGYIAENLEYLGESAPLSGIVNMRLHIVKATSLVQTGKTALEELELLEVERMTVLEAKKKAKEFSSSFLSLGLFYLEESHD